MAKHQPTEPKTSGFLAVYGGPIGLAAVGVVCVAALIHDYRDMVRHNTANAPTLETVNLRPTPINDPPQTAIVIAKDHVCFRTQDSLVACEALIRKYPKLPPDLINLIVGFAKFYKHGDASGLLALVLFEALGQPDSVSNDSSAFGPANYLVDTFAEKLLRTHGLIDKVKQHFQHDEGAVDSVVELAKKYLKSRDKLLAVLKDPKADKKLKTEAVTQIALQREALRQQMISDDHLPVAVAGQLAHVLVTYSPDDLRKGHSYPTHLLEKHAKTLFKLIDISMANHGHLDKKNIDASFVYTPIDIKRIRVMSIKTSVGIAKIDVSRLDPNEVYPALDKRLALVARKNLSVFYGHETRQEIKDGKVVRTYKVRVPLTALQVKAELDRKWQEHYRPAKALIDRIMKLAERSEATGTMTAPKLPVFASTKAPSHPVVARN